MQEAELKESATTLCIKVLCCAILNENITLIEEVTFYLVLVQVQVLVLYGTAPVQHCFGSVSERFLDRTRSMCSICSVCVYFV